jgi:hypothetical protein
MSSDHAGDPWVAKWADPDGAVHKLYEQHVAVLEAFAAGRSCRGLSATARARLVKLGLVTGRELTGAGRAVLMAVPR